MTSSSPPPRYPHPPLLLSINTSTLQIPQPFSPSPSRALNSTPTSSSSSTSYFDPGSSLSLKALSLQQRDSPVHSIHSEKNSPQTPSPTDTIRTLRPPLPPTPEQAISEKFLLLRKEREQQQRNRFMSSPLPSPITREEGGEVGEDYSKIGGIEDRNIDTGSQACVGEPTHTRGGGGENIPIYEDESTDPPIQPLEKGRLLEVLGSRGRERGSDGDAGSSKSAELGSRDHLERWRNEQVNLEGRKRVVRKRESLGSEMSRSSVGTAMSESVNGRRGQGGSSAGTGGGSLVGMSDAEIGGSSFTRLTPDYRSLTSYVGCFRSIYSSTSFPFGATTSRSGTTTGDGRKSSSRSFSSSHYGLSRSFRYLLGRLSRIVECISNRLHRVFIRSRKFCKFADLTSILRCLPIDIPHSTSRTIFSAPSSAVSRKSLLRVWTTQSRTNETSLRRKP